MDSTAAFHAIVWGSVPGLGGFKETKMFLPHPRVKVSIVESLRDRVVFCSASDRQGSNFESCVWRTVSSHSSHYPLEVLMAQFSLYVHKGGLKPNSFHFVKHAFHPWRPWVFVYPVPCEPHANVNCPLMFRANDTYTCTRTCDGDGSTCSVCVLEMQRHTAVAANLKNK